MASNVKMDFKALHLSLAKATEAATLPIARQIAKEQFNNSLSSFTSEIYADPVSQEIMQGPDVERSKFIKGTGSRKYGGNLFSFIGFFAGDEPIDELINYIRKACKINTFNVRLIKNRYTFNVIIPSEGSIKAAFPFPDGSFGTRSWITGVEKGIPNIINYMRWDDQGRSTGGFQAKGEMNKTFVPSRGYFTSKYKRFTNSFSKK